MLCDLSSSALKNIIMNLGTVGKYIMESGLYMYVFASSHLVWQIAVVYQTTIVLVEIIILVSVLDFELGEVCYKSRLEFFQVAQIQSGQMKQ
jgi:hypothetical protein